MANDLDLAWAAGFIDGEGCIGIYGRSDHESLSLRLSVAQADRRPLNVLAEMFGGRVREMRARGNQRQAFVWEQLAQAASQTLREIVPFLRHKTRQAELAIEFQSRLVRGRTGRPYRLTDEERAYRNELAAEVKRLKREVT